MHPALTPAAYWYPLYGYVRSRGHDAEDAADLTQAYFATLLEKDYLSKVSPERGRFRAFLLRTLQHFLASDWRRRMSQKRGGQTAFVSLDLEDAERRYRTELEHDETPEVLFERAWATTVLERAFSRLEQEASERGRGREFAALKQTLTETGHQRPYREIADELGSTEPAVKVAVHRLRKRFGELLRDELLETISDPANVNEELRSLFDALGRGGRSAV